MLLVLSHMKTLQNLITLGAIKRRNDNKAYKARKVIGGYELMNTCSEDEACRVDTIPMIMPPISGCVLKYDRKNINL
jgi:hypothetical protein